jgi:hypothetical protein
VGSPARAVLALVSRGESQSRRLRPSGSPNVRDFHPAHSHASRCGRKAAPVVVSMSAHRSPCSSPRRRPVAIAVQKNASSRWRSTAAKNSCDCSTKSGVISARSTRDPWASAATFRAGSPQRTASLNAALRTARTPRIVAGESRFSRSPANIDSTFCGDKACSWEADNRSTSRRTTPRCVGEAYFIDS